MGHAGVVRLSVLLLSAAAAVAADQPSPPRPHPDNARPVYPESARQQAITGDVAFTAEVDETGAVTAVTIRSVPRKGLGFESAVEDIVRTWRFDPATLDGRPVRGTYPGSVAYRLFPQDERRIAAAVARVAAAWNAHDADGVLAEIDATPPPDERVAAMVKPIEGIRAWLLGELTADAPGLQPSARLVQFITPTFAVAEIERIQPQGSGDLPTLTALLVKRNQDWGLMRLGVTELLPLRPDPRRGAIRRVGQGLREPRKIGHVSPRYPEVAKQARVTGVVILEVVIDEEGRVIDAKVLRGVPLLTEAAMDAVRQWRYEPTVVDGTAVPVLMTVTVNFMLR